MSRHRAAPEPAGGTRGGAFGIALTSLFSDTGHEMVTAVLPSFLTTVLGASAAWLGVVDGVSDALTGVAKVAGGALADDPALRRRVATGGYLLTATATAGIGLTGAVWQTGLLRGLAWVARGLRSPARDGMLAAVARAGRYGRAFGLERAGDNLGAVLGPILAGLLVAWVGVRPTIGLSIVPGLLAAGAITLAARRVPRAPATGPRPSPLARYRGLRGTSLAAALAPIALFEGGTLAATLLILRSEEVLRADGLDLAGAVGVSTLLYAGHNAAAALAAGLTGGLADRHGPHAMLAVGAAASLLAYLGLAGAPSRPGLAGAFLLAGVGIGVAEPAQSAAIARLLPDARRGTGFGLLGLVQAGGDLTATVVGGILFAAVSPLACFAYAAAWMAGCLLLLAGRRRPGGTPPGSPRYDGRARIRPPR